MKENNFKRLWTYLRAYRASVYLAVAFKVLSIVMSVLEPFVLGLAITELTQNLLDMAQGKASGLNVSYIFWILVLYLIRGTLYSVGAYYANYFMTNAVQATVGDLRKELSHKVNHLPVSYFDRQQFGDLLGRFTTDVETVSNALQQSFLQIINAIVTIVLVLAMVYSINLPLALVVTLIIPLTYFTSSRILKFSQPSFKRQADIVGTLNGFVQEHLTGFQIVKLYGREDETVDEFQAIVDELEEVGFQAGFRSGLMAPLLHGLSDFAYVIIAFLSGLQVLAGRLTIGNMQAFVQYVWQISQPVQILTQISGQLQSAQSSLDRIFQVLDQPAESETGETALAQPLSGQVTFDQVSFSYSADKPLIQNFNLDVEPGQMVAIVGPTGAGKTTLINLLMRFYDVDGGAIRVDGRDIRSIDRQDYRRQFGMVLQDAWLYEASIEENLRFGNLEATHEEIVAAAKAANVDYFIRSLPGGYKMQMNQESSNISLGQKQLLTIARALLADPKILILDEATSSVDTRLELLIQKAMKTLMQGRTSFVIAHRLSTIQEADKILVLKEGQIIEQGTHTSLLADQGFYYDLYQSQFARDEE